MNRTMKETNIPWLGKIPNDWQIKQVKQVFNICKEKANEKNPVVLSLARDSIKIRDISNNEGQLAESYDNYNPVKIGDLLLNPMDLYSGANCNVSEVEGVISPAYSKLRAKVELEPRFFDYYFKTQYWTMAMFAHGKGVSFDNRRTLNNETLKGYYLPFPTREEQIKIVEAIKNKEERINALIANEVKQIEKLKAYKQALISEVVIKGLDPNVPMKDSGVDWIDEIPSRWGVKRFKELFSIDKGLSITKADLTIDGAQVISYGQIHSKRNKSYKIDNRLIRYVNSEFAKQYSKSLVKIGDFIIADTSEDIAGSGDFVFNDMYDTYAGYHTIILRAKNDYILGKFIAFLMMSDYWKRQIQSRVSGVKVYSISARILSKTTFLIPSETDCHNIVHFLTKRMSLIDKDILNKQRKIELLRSYHQSIIYEYITGKKTSNGSEEKAL